MGDKQIGKSAFLFQFIGCRSTTRNRFDVTMKKAAQVRIGGGIFTHANGSSAIPVEGGYFVFSSETLNPTATSAVRLIQVDASWRPVNIRVVLDEDGTNASMATAVRLQSGYTIMHLRSRTGVSLRQKAPAAPQPGSILPDDSGALVRMVLAPDGTIVSRETLVSDGANRTPHDVVWRPAGNHLGRDWYGPTTG